MHAAQQIANIAYINEHFYIPQSVSSSFTGREEELSDLREHLVAKPMDKLQSIQKRFVIFGLAGSGKTQTCCKFAVDNKNSFWGVFWLNASSEEHLKQSFITLSEVAKVAPNEAAVKGWLSSLGSNKPWLLIIDNADDIGSQVEQSFPDNMYGSIVITTRNPLLRMQGTVGPRYFQFDGLNELVSIRLLLQLADEASPWTLQAVDFAKSIAKKIGYLPLALTYAGKTIAAKFCTLQTYLDFYDRCWARIRQMKGRRDSSTIPDASAAIYKSYEVMYQSLASKKTQASEDALDLLKIFPFLDRQNIKLEIFIRAANNPKLEEALATPENIWQNSSKSQLPWSKVWKNIIIQLIQGMSRLSFRPVLPRFLILDHDFGDFDELRLREAISELLKMSLISASSGSNDRYSMHAAVHDWARQRPEMTLADQAIWCQITSTILSRAILLPPMDDTEDGERFRRELLPHVAHVGRIEQDIKRTFAQNRRNRYNIIPVPQARITSDHLLQLVKFSLVYFQGHQLEEAEKLQRYVVDFLVQHLGLDNIQTIRMLRLLSRTYFQLARMDEAIELQRRAYDACLETLGEEHPETLQVMDQYGSVLWLQGRFQESLSMHKIVVERLSEQFGAYDVLTLKAMGGLGRALCKDFQFAQAIQVNNHAFTELKSTLGASHSATLEAMDNLAMAYFDRTAYRQGYPGDLDRALELEQQIFTKRVERLGREHYHTLWAGLNLARIRAIRGEVKEALAIFLPGLAVVQRDLEPDHFLFLFTELHHARILMCAKQYAKAEILLSRVVEAHEKTRRRHPDRLLALFSLVKCRRVLGKDSEHTEILYQRLLDGAKETFGASHPAVENVLDERALSGEFGDVYDENGRPLPLNPSEMQV